MTDPRTLRIALVASTFGVGGAERVTAGILDRLPASRFDLRLYFLHAAGTVGRDLFARGMRGSERLCRRPRDPLGFARLVSELRAWGPQVVWCMDHRDAMFAGRLAAVVAGRCPSVVSSHSTGLVAAHGGTRPSFGAMDRLLMEFTARVVAVSPSHLRYLRDREGIPASRLALIENGVALDAWPRVTPASRAEARASLGLDAGEAVVAMVAAMRPEKAHGVLLKALRRMADHGRRVVALFAGDGECRAALEADAKQLGIEDRVRFLGVRHDVARLLHASDAVALPSRAVVETLPLALLEAMACGIPVVASAVGSVPDLVENGRTGWLVAPGSVPELTDRLLAVLDDPGAARAMAEQAYGRVHTRYGIERTASLYSQLFEEIVA